MCGPFPAPPGRARLPRSARPRRDAPNRTPFHSGQCSPSTHQVPLPAKPRPLAAPNPSPPPCAPGRRVLTESPPPCPPPRGATPARDEERAPAGRGGRGWGPRRCHHPCFHPVPWTPPPADGLPTAAYRPVAGSCRARPHPARPAWHHGPQPKRTPFHTHRPGPTRPGPAESQSESRHNEPGASRAPGADGVSPPPHAALCLRGASSAAAGGKRRPGGLGRGPTAGSIRTPALGRRPPRPVGRGPLVERPAPIVCGGRAVLRFPRLRAGRAGPPGPVTQAACEPGPSFPQERNRIRCIHCVRVICRDPDPSHC